MIPPVKRTATGLKVVIWYKMLCHFTHFTLQWKIQMFRRVNYYPLLFLRKVSIHPSFNEWQIHRFRTSLSYLSSLGHPWAYGEKGNEGEEVHVQGQPAKIRPLSDLCPCTSCHCFHLLRASEAETMLWCHQTGQLGWCSWPGTQTWEPQMGLKHNRLKWISGPAVSCMLRVFRIGVLSSLTRHNHHKG